MKNIQITLQPLSLIVGAGLLGIMLITTGAFTPQGPNPQRDINHTQIIDGTWMRIDSGLSGAEVTYTVPQGKVFHIGQALVGGCGSTNQEAGIRRSDGSSLWHISNSSSNPSEEEGLDGFVALAGEVLYALGSSCGNNQTWIAGYLVDA